LSSVGLEDGIAFLTERNYRSEQSSLKKTMLFAGVTKLMVLIKVNLRKAL